MSTKKKAAFKCSANCSERVCTMSLALALGILWGVGIALTTICAIFYEGYATAFLEVIKSIYPGYSVSYSGALIGLVYGFIGMFVNGYIIAWLYDMLTRRCGCA
ncbi:MAG: bacteriophage holin [Candidatus Micrarchaeia archaeon]